VVAGIVLTAVLVPAGMGYAEAAGLPAIYGLYATIVPLAAYALFGPSRILVLGSDSSLVPLIAATVLPLAAGSSAEAAALADAVLGRVDELKGYHDVTRHPEARRIPGLVLFRWDAPLFFANAEVFADHLRQAIASSPTPARWVVVAAEPVTDLDTTAADVLQQLDKELAADGVDLRFAEMKGPVKDKLRRYVPSERFSADHFYPTIGTAVRAYLDETGVEWVDWEDQTAPTGPAPGNRSDRQPGGHP